MRVSQARMNEVVRIRDAALKIIGDRGMDGISATVRGTCRHAYKKAEHNGLEISLSPFYGQTLDIWDGRKVLSVAWDVTGALTVVGFHPGPWQARI